MELTSVRYKWSEYEMLIGPCFQLCGGNWKDTLEQLFGPRGCGVSEAR